MIKTTKNTASEATKATMPSSGPPADRAGRRGRAGGPGDAAAGACEWARSHSGRRPRTGGTSVKLSSGGGEGVAHSSVHAFHGLSPAAGPRRRLRTTLYRNTRTDAPSRYAPMVESMLKALQWGRSG